MKHGPHVRLLACAVTPLLFFSGVSGATVTPWRPSVSLSIPYPPAPQAAIVGGQANFTVLASGDAPLAYQWRKDGADLLDGPGIAGAATDVLRLSQIQPDDAGDYSVVVTNGSGSTTSVDAALTVAPPRGGDVDGSFNPGASVQGSFFRCDGCDAQVQAVAVQPDGKILIAGAFKTVGAATRHGVARLNPDGTTDLTFQNAMAGADDIVLSLALQTDGRVVVGGFFSTINGVGRTRLARLNADGSLDPTFETVVTAATGISAVYSVLVQSDGKVLIGGSFDAVDGVSRHRIARVNTDGSLDTTFQEGMSGAIGGGDFDTQVDSMALQPDGRVLIAGGFGTVNGVSRRCVARLNADGSLDTSFQNPQVTRQQSYAVYALALQPDGKAVILGKFTSVGGVSRQNLARLNSDGTLDSGFAPAGVGLGRAAVVLPDGKLLVSWSETLIRLNADGTTDASFANAGIDARSMALLSGGRVVVGSSATAPSRQTVTVLQPDGSVDASFQYPRMGVDMTVYSVALQADGRILIGGAFTHVGGLSRNGIARLHPDGTLDTSFLNGWTGVAGIVRSVRALPNGKVLIGGSFNAVNGVNVYALARLEFDGSLDTTFPGLGGQYSGVRCLTLQADGSILIGGNFPTGTSAQFGVMHMNAAGEVLSFTPTGDDVYAIAVQADGKLVIGGAFQNVQSQPRNFVARLSADGNLDSSFVSGVQGGSYSAVESIALQADGKVLIGGAFTSVDGLVRNRIARLNADGTVDASFDATGATGNYERVYSVALQRDERVLLAGDFAAVNGTSRNFIARLRQDGSLDTSFEEGMAGPDDQVRSLALQPDGRVLAGGRFAAVNGVPSNFVTRLFGSVPSTPVPDADADGIRDDLDNCPIDGNASQSDANHDDVGDACDLDDGSIWEWRESKSTIRWQAEHGPASWNVYTGNLDFLKATGTYTQDPAAVPFARRQCGLTMTIADDAPVPQPSGLATFSLITGVTNGIEGGLGASSAGPRPNSNACP